MDGHQKFINNDFYDDLKEGWYSKLDHPIALLRAEHDLLTPWLLDSLPPVRKILDIGCGAGMIANALARAGHRVTGVDLSESSLQIAKSHDITHSVHYLKANAYSLPFGDGEFDAVCLMDTLEHVEEPGLMIGEAARVLKAKGILFFNTFNRTFLSYLIAVKGVEWFLPKSPKNMHIHSLFITPEELENMFEAHKLEMQRILGVRPRFSKEFWQILSFRRVPKDFSFCFCTSLKTGYCGYARKRGNFSLY